MFDKPSCPLHKFRDRAVALRAVASPARRRDVRCDVTKACVESVDARVTDFGVAIVDDLTRRYPAERAWKVDEASKQTRVKSELVPSLGSTSVVVVVQEFCDGSGRIPSASDARGTGFGYATTLLSTEASARTLVAVAQRSGCGRSRTAAVAFTRPIDAVVTRTFALFDHKTAEPKPREFCAFTHMSTRGRPVYNPFLPHGYEEREGLDYFGNDLRKKQKEVTT